MRSPLSEAVGLLGLSEDLLHVEEQLLLHGVGLLVAPGALGPLLSRHQVTDIARSK